ncbi:MAG TPA: thioredoxin-disulfide reductase [Candidatus Sumerlaeota bacterium]|nr:thioredoxin-disulfide reductase [Candidatus Sumerlaeota bacterium]
MTSNSNEIRNVVIVGSGPAGWTAAIYLSRANLSPVVYAGAQVGGQLTTTTEVENFPGFPEGRDGPELMADMEAQAKRYGTEIVYEEIESIDAKSSPFTLKAGGGAVIKAHAIIICTGASPKMLGLPGEKTFWSRGVHTCAVCDGGFYRGKTVAVVGGGDSATEEATYLAKLADKVYLIHRREELRASKIMAERALKNPKIEPLWNTVVEDVGGDLSGKFPKTTHLKLKNLKDNSRNDLPVDAMFVAIGHTPNTKFLNGAFTADENGYLIVNDAQETNVEGVYAAGDVHDHVYRQAITAAGYGCKAALEVERYLTRKGLVG